MTTPIRESPNKRRNLARWRENRLRRLAFSDSTVLQAARAAQLQRDIEKARL